MRIAQKRELLAELLKAVKEKNFERYFALLQEFEIQNQCDVELDHEFHYALHFAAGQGNTDAVKKLLALRATIDVRDVNGMTPLLYAAKNGKLDTLLLLLEKGAKKMAYDNSGMNALHWAAAGNNNNIITALVKEQGFNINQILDDSGSGAPLHVAAAHGHIPAINRLIELGAQKDMLNQYGATALHIAAREGKTDAVAALIKDHGFDQNAEDMLGRTPSFHAAMGQGTIETINTLVNCGANINASNSLGYSVLHGAVGSNRPSIIIPLIRDYGLHPNTGIERGHTPLGLAITNGQCLAEFTLLLMGASLSDQEETSYKNHSRSCLKQLKTTADKQTMLDALERESLAPWDPNVTDNSDLVTPLITAADKSCLSCVKFLLKDPRTNPNAQDGKLKTALHYTVNSWMNEGSTAICARLLNLRRTNVGIKSSKDKTARQCLDKKIQDMGYRAPLLRCARHFELRKMRVQAYLSLKNARCSEQCSEKVCTHLPQLPADLYFKIVGLLTEESLPES